VSVTLEDLQAHWVRDWIKAPGFEDSTTRVHWMQCGALYADIRVPLERPDLTGASALADLPPPALLQLMQAEGFAGTAHVENAVCTWQREVNWHGTPDGIDAGHMSFDATGALIEDGVYAEYAELWENAPHAPQMAHRVASALGVGVLVFSADQFLLGLGRPDTPATAPLVEALTTGQVPDTLPAHFRSHYILGRWDGQTGTAELATTPFLEGRDVLHSTPHGMTLLVTDFHGDDSVIDLALSD